MTDILTWKQPVFGGEPDDLIRQIVTLGGTRMLESPAYNLIGNDPRYFPDVDIEAFTGKLRVLRDRLHAEAIERGWEVD